MMHTNMKSNAYFASSAQAKRQRKPYLYGCNLKPIYGAVHLSAAKKMRLQ